MNIYNNEEVKKIRFTQQITIIREQKYFAREISDDTKKNIFFNLFFQSQEFKNSVNLGLRINCIFICSLSEKLIQDLINDDFKTINGYDGVLGKKGILGYSKYYEKLNTEVYYTEDLDNIGVYTEK